ncbi:phosphoribosylformylglycinamidine synthase [Haliovirga abyssi]|uniref:Phosphoribosylformylglycinamidine synthase n=1 Tax=Haliovirga abyssi TaxID=2996794 RepID=A0AAU9D992_9FUSO|nr:phosphoribosylformylglycinamidine synthase [Haliovirga abyssi]BDU49855.1 phosphoribosylformylglycinamidine synthase [Haliovirga abyssi]
MNNFRIFVEKKDEFRIESQSLLSDLKENLQIQSLNNLRLINIYEVFDISDEDLSKAKQFVFSEPATDIIFDSIDLSEENYFSTEYLPGQFDQRSDSAMQCLKLLIPENRSTIKSGKLIILEGNLSKEEIQKIKDYYINPVESREKDLSLDPIEEDINAPFEVEIHTNFINLTSEELESFRIQNGLAMSFKDIEFVQNYFKNEEKRDPSETEIKVLDTYWSDHCRHTTFETEIKNVIFPKGNFNEVLQNTYNEYLKSREFAHGSKKPMCLMDMATISAREQRKLGVLDDLEISDEVNACSVRIKVDVNGNKENWLLMFKNETHNHPTEIEPFGGASTCIGGAIRDPLSGRSYVYQAMRVTGAANINEKIENTIEGKLPQKVISKTAAHGYSSYGNQIGLSTSFVKEIFHEGYKAKRMEVGAVVGAVKEEYVRREKPLAGDIVIMLGGKTGRDGCGGATGSSKEHTTESLVTCSAEVQKGNAPEERKIQRLFRNPNVTKLIKKSNDFGAGGVAVAIGELSDGLIINLDKVPVKYLGLNGTELAISESQERMSVVVAKEDVQLFIKLAEEENIESVVVAEITEEARLIMKWKGKDIVNLSRAFLDTNGVRSETEVEIEEFEKIDIFKNKISGNSIKEKFLNNLSKDNVASQKGMVEMFDATIGATTVLMPYGGKYQLTETEASVQKIPYLNGETNTASIMSFGFNPNISSWSPFHGAAYAMVESISKIVAVGGKWQGIRFSFQEYFQRLGNNKKNWGKPFSALLGTLFVQKGFELPAIGGKDSMSGSFNDINVPPTLISFAVNTENADKIISNEFKKENNYIYLIKHNPTEDFMPNIEELKENYDYIYKNISEGNIISASTIKFGGVAEAVAKMSFGNKIGSQLDEQFVDNIFDLDYGSILVESKIELKYKNGLLIGKTTNSNFISIGNEKITLDEALEAWTKTYKKVYPSEVDLEKGRLEIKDYRKDINIISKPIEGKPKVFVPVFPGTNCEYDSINSFVKAGAIADSMVFRNQNSQQIIESINEMKSHIDSSQIIMLSGGFSAGDEPDGSGKFIANILTNNLIKDAIEKFLKRDGLILGICNGFQALIKSGLLPYGKIGEVNSESPTLAKNNINRHISKIVNTRITSNKSPWLNGIELGTIHSIPVSHGEGKFVANEKLLKSLFENGQVATQYVDFEGYPSMNGTFNPNGSYQAIEGITSLDGRILGKMGHSERVGTNVHKNIYGEKEQGLFINGVKYFK